MKKKNKRRIERKVLKKKKIKVVKKGNGRDKSINLQKSVGFNFLKLNNAYKNFVTQRKREKEKKEKLKITIYYILNDKLLVRKPQRFIK